MNSHSPFYKLTDVPGFRNVLNNITNDNCNYTVTEYSTKSNEKYKIVKYNKETLLNDVIPVYGILRSVIINSENKVVCFAPPKSLPAEKFMQNYPEKNEHIIAEEFVEGTMINMFYDNSVGVSGCWQIATRNTIGAEVYFYKQRGKTFRQMFLEACAACNFDFSRLNPEYCYSFVLQHPENRIVVPFSKPSLYLVSVYKIENNDRDVNVIVQNIDKSGWTSSTFVKFPENYDFASYSELIEKYASPNTPYNIMGVIIKNTNTNERIKIRNPIYEEVRHLRGNQPKLQYQYLCLRHEGKVSEFLKYYPEMKEMLSEFRDQVHLFTTTLHRNYLSCYVFKEKPLIEFSNQYRTHMFKLHEHYLNNLREQHLSVTNNVVITYVNTLHPSLLMYSLNYNLRKRFFETLKVDV
jgi:hypothetical protein